jgi:glycerophosphoryl diester phosphodiesterase
MGVPLLAPITISSEGDHMRQLALFPNVSRPLLFAHRGLNHKFLENTLSAFQAALEAGVPGIELDVHLTKDGNIVVFHDDTTGRIERRVCPDEPFRNLTLESSTLDELRSLPIGAQIPLLDELFEAFGAWLYYDIELKSRSTSDTDLATKVAAAIHAHGLEKSCVISSFNPFILRHFRKAAPRIPIGIIWSHARELYWFLRHGEGALVADVDFLKPEASLASRLPLYLRLSGKPVIPWTVNDPAVARNLIARGVCGIISDEADVVRRELFFSLSHESRAREEGGAPPRRPASRL